MRNVCVARSGFLAFASPLSSCYIPASSADDAAFLHRVTLHVGSVFHKLFPDLIDVGKSCTDDLVVFFLPGRTYRTLPLEHSRCPFFVTFEEFNLLLFSAVIIDGGLPSYTSQNTFSCSLFWEIRDSGN